jgi:hypothetical protein
MEIDQYYVCCFVCARVVQAGRNGSVPDPGHDGGSGAERRPRLDDKSVEGATPSCLGSVVARGSLSSMNGTVWETNTLSSTATAVAVFAEGAGSSGRGADERPSGAHGEPFTLEPIRSLPHAGHRFAAALIVHSAGGRRTYESSGTRREEMACGPSLEATPFLCNAGREGTINSGLRMF